MTIPSITAVLFILLTIPAFSQSFVAQPGDSTPALSNATAQFIHVVQAQKEIYTGREHIAYPPTIEGFAYFMSKEWQPGAVQYDGIVYPNEHMLYDLAKDQLIIQRPDGFAVELRSDKTDGFVLLNHRFMHFTNESGLKPGFYDQLASGKIMVLAKREKIFEERLQDNAANQKFREHTTYYAGQANAFHTIRNLHSLLGMMGNKSSTVQQQLRKMGVRYRKNPEAALIMAAQYFNQIQP